MKFLAPAAILSAVLVLPVSFSDDAGAASPQSIGSQKLPQSAGSQKPPSNAAAAQSGARYRPVTKLGVRRTEVQPGQAIGASIAPGGVASKVDAAARGTPKSSTPSPKVNSSMQAAVAKQEAAAAAKDAQTAAARDRTREMKSNIQKMIDIQRSMQPRL